MNQVCIRLQQSVVEKTYLVFNRMTMDSSSQLETFLNEWRKKEFIVGYARTQILWKHTKIATVVVFMVALQSQGILQGDSTAYQLLLKEWVTMWLESKWAALNS